MFVLQNQWQIQGGRPGPAPPTDQNFLNFMQFFEKIWQICMLGPPPEGLAPPPTRNPGSAPENVFPLFINENGIIT